MQKFCSTDPTRLYLNEPFTSDGHTYATDGSIIVRTTVPLADSLGNPGVPRVGENIHFPPSNAPVLVVEWSVADEPPKIRCAECGGTKLRVCPECGTEVACTECKDGFIAQQEAPITIGERSFAPKYIRLLKLLPGLELVKFVEGNEEMSALAFRFEGGDGLLMPLRRNS